jgi:hypothetical protein
MGRTYGPSMPRFSLDAIQIGEKSENPEKSDRAASFFVP